LIVRRSNDRQAVADGEWRSSLALQTLSQATHPDFIQ
jgi:hypothetical protein